MRVAPASTILRASAAVRIPPDAFTPISGPTTLRSSATSSTVAPPGPNPVLVLTNAAPAAFASAAPIAFSSRLSAPVSRMTLTARGPATSTTAWMSRSTSA